MKELSMHILDIAQNSIRGKAANIQIEVNEDIIGNIFSFRITDDGTGIPDEIFNEIKNPFTTSRTMRKVGLGIPMLDLTCTHCDGKLDISTEKGKGTHVTAVMKYDHIDRPPLGDMASTIAGFMVSYDDVEIQYIHKVNDAEFDVKTSELIEVLGEDVPLASVEVSNWLKNYIEEELANLSVQ